MDQQLRWILQQEVLHSVIVLRVPPEKKNMRLKFSSQSASSSIYADENDVSHVADL